MLLLGTLLRLGAVVVTAIAVVKMFLPQVTRKLARLGMLNSALEQNVSVSSDRC